MKQTIMLSSCNSINIQLQFNFIFPTGKQALSTHFLAQTIASTSNDDCVDDQRNNSSNNNNNDVENKIYLLDLCKFEPVGSSSSNSSSLDTMFMLNSRTATTMTNSERQQLKARRRSEIAIAFAEQVVKPIFKEYIRQLRDTFIIVDNNSQEEQQQEHRKKHYPYSYRESNTGDDDLGNNKTTCIHRQVPVVVDAPFFLCQSSSHRQELYDDYLVNAVDVVTPIYLNNPRYRKLNCDSVFQEEGEKEDNTFDDENENEEDSSLHLLQVALDSTVFSSKMGYRHCIEIRQTSNNNNITNHDFLHWFLGWLHGRNIHEEIVVATMNDKKRRRRNNITRNSMDYDEQEEKESDSEQQQEEDEAEQNDKIYKQLYDMQISRNPHAYETVSHSEQCATSIEYIDEPKRFPLAKHVVSSHSNSTNTASSIVLFLPAESSSIMSEVDLQRIINDWIQYTSCVKPLQGKQRFVVWLPMLPTEGGRNPLFSSSNNNNNSERYIIDEKIPFRDWKNHLFQLGVSLNQIQTPMIALWYREKVENDKQKKTNKKNGNSKNSDDDNPDDALADREQQDQQPQILTQFPPSKDDDESSSSAKIVSNETDFISMMGFLQSALMVDLSRSFVYPHVGSCMTTMNQHDHDDYDYNDSRRNRGASSRHHHQKQVEQQIKLQQQQQRDAELQRRHLNILSSFGVMQFDPLSNQNSQQPVNNNYNNNNNAISINAETIEKTFKHVAMNNNNNTLLDLVSANVIKNNDYYIQFAKYFQCTGGGGPSKQLGKETSTKNTMNHQQYSSSSLMMSTTTTTMMNVDNFCDEAETDRSRGLEAVTVSMMGKKPTNNNYHSVHAVVDRHHELRIFIPPGVPEMLEPEIEDVFGDGGGIGSTGINKNNANDQNQQLMIAEQQRKKELEREEKRRKRLEEFERITQIGSCSSSGNNNSRKKKDSTKIEEEKKKKEFIEARDKLIREKNYPKLPQYRSGYMLFMQEVAASGGVNTNNNNMMIPSSRGVTALAKQWKALPAAKRLEYDKRVEDDKQRYRRECKEYQMSHQGELEPCDEIKKLEDRMLGELKEKRRQQHAGNRRQRANNDHDDDSAGDGADEFSDDDNDGDDRLLFDSDRDNDSSNHQHHHHQQQSTSASASASAKKDASASTTAKKKKRKLTWEEEQALKDEDFEKFMRDLDENVINTHK